MPDLSGRTFASSLFVAFLCLLVGLAIHYRAYVFAAFSWLHSQVRAAAAPPETDPVTKIILRDNSAGGPFGRTGGQVFKNTPEQCAQIAELLKAHAPGEGIPIELALAWLWCESRLSILSVNPNNQDAQPNETPDQAFNHLDLSIAQFDGSTVRSWPEFVGKTRDEIKAKLFDPAYVIPVWTQYAGDSMAWGRMCTTQPTLPALNLPDNGAVALSILSYNAGRSGALAIARQPYDAGRWRYALTILNKAAQYKQELAA
jgi:hypothetical protein